MKVKVYPLHNGNKIREAPQLQIEMYLSHSFICKVRDEPCFVELELRSKKRARSHEEHLSPNINLVLVLHVHVELSSISVTTVGEDRSFLTNELLYLLNIIH